MWGFFRRYIPSFGWIFPGSSPIDSLLQGVIAACAVSILDHLLRIHLHVQCLNDPGHVDITAAKFRWPRQILDSLHLCVLTILFIVVGSRVASLVVLEFSLRTIPIVLSNNHPMSNKQIFLLCHFSLGCGMTATLSYLNEGAPHSTLSLALSTALSGLIMWYVRKLSKHISLMYELHSKERYCGLCIVLLTTWHNIPKLLCNALKVAFGVADVAAFFLINRDFISTSEAIRFWTPLTICYTLLVIYMQEQKQNPSEQTTYQTVGVRMGGLLILTLTVGRWMDVVHVLLCLFGEICCLIQAGPMLEVCRQQECSGTGGRGGIRQPRLGAQRRSKVSDIQTADS